MMLETLFFKFTVEFLAIYIIFLQQNELVLNYLFLENWVSIAYLYNQSKQMIKEMELISFATESLKCCSVFQPSLYNQVRKIG